MPHVSFDRLVEPCERGHYWYGRRSNPPAILKAQTPPNYGKYMVIATNGVIFDENVRIKYWTEPEVALRFLKAWEGLLACPTQKK